jgi:hypothetical protein
MPPLSFDDHYQIEQVENEIFYDGNTPDRDHRWRCYEYSFYAFYKVSNNQNIHININLHDNWTECGKWTLGNWNIIQYSGTNLNSAYENEVRIRTELGNMLLRGEITELRTRFSYPKLP